MDNYTHKEVIYTLLGRPSNGMVRLHTAEVIHGKLETHHMVVTERCWIRAQDGDLDERTAIGRAREELIKNHII